MRQTRNKRHGNSGISKSPEHRAKISQSVIKSRGRMLRGRISAACCRILAKQNKDIQDEVMYDNQ